MLELKHLVKNYATQKAVDDISFSVKKGSIFGLLGPNGAGKSSLLRMVTGITMPDSGEIIFDNEPFQLLKHCEQIGYMPEERGLYKKMKIGEQAMYLAQLKGLSRSEANAKINFWFKRLDMSSWVNKKVEDLSKGMSQKLQFVLTVVHDPKLLILDEPFSGLDPLNSEIIKNEIYELAEKGTTIIFSTHRMEQVEEICQEIVLVNKGKSILQGDVKSVKEQFKLNHFKLEINDELKGFDNNLVSRNGNEYILHFNNHQEANTVLNYCIQKQIKIISFQEVLPSLNEIFINQVDGSAARQFINN